MDPMEIEERQISQQTKKNRQYPRRYYQSLKQFWDDFSTLLSSRDRIRKAMRPDILPVDFRERLMLTVTEVNQCRYCRRFHIAQAREIGISNQEITDYLKGNIPEDIPEDQKLALCYGQHWAESGADPDPEFRQEITAYYGREVSLAIDTVLQMIWMGNLLGNFFDYLLFRISFGHWGGVSTTSQPLD